MQSHSITPAELDDLPRNNRVTLLLTDQEHADLVRLAKADSRSKTSMARIIYHKGIKQNLPTGNNDK
jgi:hypothetical protein